MKKIIAILFACCLSFAIAPANADAQILKDLGNKAVNAAKGAATKAVGKSVEHKVENKVESKVGKWMDKTLDALVGKDEVIEERTDNTEALTQRASSLGTAIGAMASSAASATTISGAATVQLRDFSQQNAERAEFNKTLKFDNWD